MRNEKILLNSHNYLKNNASSSFLYSKYNQYKFNNNSLFNQKYYNSNLKNQYQNKYYNNNININNNLNSNNPSIKRKINVTTIKYEPYKQYIYNEIDLLNLKMKCDLINHKLNRIKYYINDEDYKNINK